MNDDQQKVANRWLVLALLILVYMLSAADRQIISVLAEPIRLDLKLSDTQLGMLSGFTFAFFYTVFGVPFGWLADRVQRFRLIAAICVFWSACTALCGMSASFVQISLARVGVAVGEAGCAPATYSLIGDHFPRNRRATAFGIYSVGFPFGAALGTASAAWIAAHYHWRMAFYATAVPGLFIAAALLLLPHPRRGRLDDAASIEPPVAPPFRDVLREFLSRPVLWMTSVAGCFSSLTSYGFLIWTPALLMRTKAMSLMDLSSKYSLVQGGTMMVGAILSGWLVDRYSDGKGKATALVPGISSLFAVPFTLMAIWSPQWRTALPLMVVPFVVFAMWYPPSLARIQNSCRAETRSMMMGLVLTIIGVVGIGGGPALVGLLSDLLAKEHPGTSINWALTAIVPFFVVAAVAHIINAFIVDRVDPAPIPAVQAAE